MSQAQVVLYNGFKYTTTTRQKLDKTLDTMWGKGFVSEWGPLKEGLYKEVKVTGPDGKSIVSDVVNIDLLSEYTDHVDDSKYTAVSADQVDIEDYLADRPV